jgi:hypothetical protein
MADQPSAEVGASAALPPVGEVTLLSPPADKPRGGGATKKLFRTSS